MKFQPGNPGGPGRPKGRIAKLREVIGELTGDGREIAEGLAAIWRDPDADNRDKLAAYELALNYLVGRPEQAVSIEADVTAGPRLEMQALLGRLPPKVIDAIVAELDTGNPPVAELAAADPPKVSDDH